MNQMVEPVKKNDHKNNKHGWLMMAYCVPLFGACIFCSEIYELLRVPAQPWKCCLGPCYHLSSFKGLIIPKNQYTPNKTKGWNLKHGWFVKCMSLGSMVYRDVLMVVDFYQVPSSWLQPSLKLTARLRKKRRAPKGIRLPTIDFQGLC